MPTVETILRVREKLSLGRAYVLHRSDYYGGILLEMTVEVVDAPDVTMGITRGLVLYVNGDWLLNDPELQTDDVVGACLAHECEHPLRGLERLEDLPNKELANVAGDMAINFNLRAEGWKLPSWVVYPESLGLPDNLTLEEYYALLQKKMDKAQQTLQQYMDSNAGKQQSGQPAGKGQQGSSTPGQGQPGTWVPKVGSGGCGGAGGNATNKQLEVELDAAYGKTTSEVESARRQVLDDIESAAAAGRGDIPGRLREMIKLRNQKPAVNWRSVLRRVIQRAVQKISGATDYSLSNPSISGQLAGCITAGLVDRQLDICLVEDTSGSMGAEQLVQARNEAMHLIRRAGVETAVHLQVDTVVQHERVIRLRDLPKLAYHGRGGTDFSLVFAHVKKKYPRTNLLVYFTDGNGYAPAQPPRGMQVVWCIVRTPFARKPANWGHVVVCDKSQVLRPPYPARK